MSGSMRKIGEYLGLVEDTGRYDEYDGEFDSQQVEAVDDRAVMDRRSARMAEHSVHPSAASVADLAERRRPAAVGSVAELARITALHPRTYNEARTVGENFREGTPVIMNLGEMDDVDAKRLVDFAAGLVFASRGTIERISAKVFLLSPPNVHVAAEDKQRIAEGGFFNQS
jgi:cell division inhibitor SepF